MCSSSNSFITGFILCIIFMVRSHGAVGAPSGNGSFNYTEALQKSMLFYEAQRSGKLPSDQRVLWRGDSALTDGEESGVDLVGGYYDAGDHVKFGFPLAFTMTMLSWGVVEFRQELEYAGELEHALEAIKWGMDYLIKAHPKPNLLYGQVGEAQADHKCWQRPEDMTTSSNRTIFFIDSDHPGTDLAAETAAAFAASSIAFNNSNRSYSETLLSHAQELFEFAEEYEGLYQNSITDASGFYSSSEYEDEMLWATAWLEVATGGLEKYQTLLESSGTGGAQTTFSWDNKYVGAQMLVATTTMKTHDLEVESWKQKYQTDAEKFVCSLVQKGDNNVQKTKGGLLFWSEWANLQYVATAIFIASVYSKNANNASINCTIDSATSSEIDQLIQHQVDYMLGLNPKSMSYMVGFGDKFPTQVHHRGASNPINDSDPAHRTCEGSFYWFNINQPNPNTILGAMVGGPDANDNYEDSRNNYNQGEPALSTNAPLLGVLARLAASPPLTHV